MLEGKDLHEEVLKKNVILRAGSPDREKKEPTPIGKDDPWGTKYNWCQFMRHGRKTPFLRKKEKGGGGVVGDVKMTEPRGSKRKMTFIVGKRSSNSN